MTQTKFHIRAEALAYRKTLSKDVRHAYSAAVCDHLRRLPELQHAHVLHAFWPMPHRGEIDIRPLLRAWHAEGKQVVLPVMQGLKGELGHHVFVGEANLKPNAWGIWEPQGTDWVSPEVVDVVLVPALALDRTGGRTGYGQGHYDRFLAETKAFKVGLVYAACLYDTVPTEPHDIPLDAIVTEEEVVRVYM